MYQTPILFDKITVNRIKPNLVHLLHSCWHKFGDLAFLQLGARRFINPQQKCLLYKKTTFVMTSFIFYFEIIKSKKRERERERERERLG